MTRSFVVSVLVLAAGSVALAGEGGGPWRRWAVVSSPEVRKSAVGDLLTVELGKAGGLELVERDELEKVQRELELSQLLGAENAAGRLELGRRLRADALVLLDRDGADPKAPLRVVIAECLQGARLLQQDLVADNDDAAAGKIAKLAADSRKRFPRGITLLLGVSAFVSRNLTRDYDAFQTGYADLLGGALSVQQGIAVLEIEEARAIVRERAGEGLADRRLGIVESEFKMEGPPGTKTPDVAITVRLVGRAASQTEALRKKGRVDLSIAARSAMLNYRCYVITSRHVSPKYHDFRPDELKALEAISEQVGKLEEAWRNAQGVVAVPPPLSEVRMYLNHYLDPRERAKPQAPEVKRTTGAVRFAPVALKVKWRDGRIEDAKPDRRNRLFGLLGLSLVRAGPGIDLYWHKGGIWAMRRPGLLEELLLNEACDFRREDIVLEDARAFKQVIWDGEQLWLSITDDSVWVVGMDGAVRAKIGREQGLPPSRKGPLLHPLSPGRVVAVGSFGSPPRAWAATITHAPSGGTPVRVFFEAKNAMPPSTKLRQPIERLDVGFHVSMIHAYQPKGESERTVLLVPRSDSDPLQIDLKTLAVSVFEYPERVDLRYDPYLRSQYPCFSHDGVLVMQGTAYYFSLVAPPGQRWPDGKPVRYMELSNPPAPNPRYDDMQSDKNVRRTHGFLSSGEQPFLEPGDGYAYFPAAYWGRLDLKTMTAQRLTSNWMPQPYKDCHGFGVSAHYGNGGLVPGHALPDHD